MVCHCNQPECVCPWRERPYLCSSCKTMHVWSAGCPGVEGPAGATNVVELRQLKPNPDIIAFLEKLLRQAQSGELLGLVAFGNYTAGWSSHGQCGETEFGPLLAAFEDWKFRRAWTRARTDSPDDKL